MNTGEGDYTLTDAEKRGLRAAIGHNSAACEIDGLPCVTCEATYREAERLLTELQQRVRSVLDGRMSGHHDQCHSWRRGFMCDCWRADLRVALGIETEEEADRG